MTLLTSYAIVKQIKHIHKHRLSYLPLRIVSINTLILILVLPITTSVRIILTWLLHTRVSQVESRISVRILGEDTSVILAKSQVLNRRRSLTSASRMLLGSGTDFSNVSVVQKVRSRVRGRRLLAMLAFSAHKITIQLISLRLLRLRVSIRVKFRIRVL